MKEELFKLGGVYKQRGGGFRRLVAVNPKEFAECGDRLKSIYAGTVAVRAEFIEATRFGDGWRRLSDGKYHGAVDDEESAYHLIPGELELINGQWLPISASAPVVEEKKEEPAFDFKRNWDRLTNIRRQIEEQGGLGNHQLPIGHVSSDPNAAMIARDGPAKPYTAPAIVQAPKPSAHPCIPALCLSPDTAEGYRLGGRFGTAL